MNSAASLIAIVTLLIGPLAGDGEAIAGPTQEPSNEVVSTGSGSWEVDLGLIGKSHRIVHEFTLFNEGEVPLRITGIGKGCTCEVLEFSSMTIPPGDAVVGQARVSSSRFASSFRATFTLEFTGSTTFEKRYTMFGGLVPHWPCFSEYVAGEAGTAALRVTLVAPRPIEGPDGWPTLTGFGQGGSALAIGATEPSRTQRPDGRQSQVLLVPIPAEALAEETLLDPFEVEFTDPKSGDVIAAAVCRRPSSRVRSDVPRYFVGRVAGRKASGAIDLFPAPDESRPTSPGVVMDSSAVAAGELEILSSVLTVVSAEEEAPRIRWSYEFGVDELAPGPHTTEVLLVGGGYSQRIEIGFVVENERRR